MIDTMLIAGIAVGLAGGLMIGALAMAIWMEAKRQGQEDDESE